MYMGTSACAPKLVKVVIQGNHKHEMPFIGDDVSSGFFLLRAALYRASVLQKHLFRSQHISTALEAITSSKIMYNIDSSNTVTGHLS